MKKLLSILTLILSATITNGEQATKPNILFICIDDLRPELPSFGKDYIKAPNIEQLFSEGRLFKRHYVQAPTCGASRFSMLTSLYPVGPGQLGNEFIAQHDHEKQPTLPAHFRRNGYYTASVGKVSHFPGNLTGKDWGDKNKPEIPNAWYSCPQTNAEWGTAQGLMHGYADGVTRAQGPAVVIEAKDARYPDDAIMDGFEEEFKQATKQDKPWFLAVGLLRPHLPFACNSKYLDLYKDATLPEIPANMKPKSNEFWHISGEYFRYKQDADPRKDHAHAELVRKHYAACISSSDDHVGKMLELLKQSGADKNTIVIFWGDHGWHLGEHHIWGKHSPYAVALHSPLCIKLPNTVKAGVPSNEVVESVDIYPTLCDLVEIEKPEHLQGKSLINIIKDPSEKSDGVSISYWQNLKTTITDGENKISDKKTDKLLQHYDLSKDPHETNNLVTPK